MALELLQQKYDALQQSHDALYKDLQSKNQEIESLTEKNQVLRSMLETSGSDEPPSLNEQQSPSHVSDDQHSVSSRPVVDCNWVEDPDVLLHYEKLKNRDLLEQIEEINTNNYIVDKKQMDVLFGASINELIPFGLNETSLARYRALFDGYYREIYKYSRNAIPFNMIPHDINYLLSCYYPVFDCSIPLCSMLSTEKSETTDYIMD
eukprot:723018_1